MNVPAWVNEAIDNAVEKGAQRLDKRRPNWIHDIDLSTLDLTSGCLCICGQLYGRYSEESVAKIIGGWVFNLVGHRVPWALDGYDRAAGKYGFYMPFEVNDWIKDGGFSYSRNLRDKVCWNRLERKWKEQIKARLAAEQVAA